MKCPTKYCRGTGRKPGAACSKCAMRAWRAANPVKKRLAWLRDRATKENMDFNIEIGWFASFLAEHNYDPTLHHIDRRSVAKGYTMDNLQVLDACDNIAKGNRERGAQLQCL